jgi:hypothetical protein
MSARRASMNDILMRVQKVEDKEAEVRRGRQLTRQRPSSAALDAHEQPLLMHMG